MPRLAGIMCVVKVNNSIFPTEVNMSTVSEFLEIVEYPAGPDWGRLAT